MNHRILTSALRAGLGTTLIAALLLSPLPFLGEVPSGHATFRPEIYAAVVVDVESGRTIIDAQADSLLYPASLTKMMTLYLVFEELGKGHLALDTELPVSSIASASEPSKLGLAAGSSISVQNAILSIVTKSANDSATALAETIAGSEANFAAVMTAKARELGMDSTRFKNASGLPHAEHVSTARDLATLALALIREFPQHYEYFSRKNFQYRGVDYPNQNQLLQTYEGADGIKTGYIKASGHNLAASATRDGKRLVAIVLGGPTHAWTRQRAAQLLDEAFGGPSSKPMITAAAGAAREVIPAVPDSLSAARTEPAKNMILPGDSVEDMVAASPGNEEILPGDPIEDMPDTNDARNAARTTKAPSELFVAPRRLGLIGKPRGKDEAKAEKAPAKDAEQVAPNPSRPARQIPAPRTDRFVWSPQGEPSSSAGSATTEARMPKPKAPAPAKAPTASAAEASDPPPPGWVVHLGSFGDRQSAERRLETARSRLPADLRDTKSQIFQHAPSRRLVSHFIEVNQRNARKICTDLQRWRMPCVVIPPGRPLVLATH